jgi:hypothetical protein
MTLAPPPVPVFPAGYFPETADFTGWVQNPFSFLAGGVVFRGQQEVSGGQALSGSSYTIIAYDTIPEDPYGGWSATVTASQPANSWLAPWTGSYEVTVYTSTASAAIWVASGALLSGGAVTGVLQGEAVLAPSGTFGGSCATFTVQLTGGADYIQGAAIVSAASSTVTSSPGRYPSMEITYVSE